jgi:PadR family transcriptional regulator PadR
VSPRAARSKVDLLQGTLDALILQTLCWGPQHGYGIMQMIRTRSANVLQVETGSLYPALHRLERRKWIAASWKISEHNQKVREYRITTTGRKQLAAERSRWYQLTAAISSIFSTPVRSEA